MPNENIKRRSFIGNISKAFFIGALPLNSEASNAEAPAADSNSFLTEPYLQNLRPESVTILWVCKQKSYSWIEISNPGQPVQKVETEKHGLKQAWNRINKIRLTNLKPGTSYQYKVFSREIKEFKPYSITYGETIEKGPFTFVTPSGKENTVKFVVFNDLHDHPNNITELMEKFSPEKDYDFVVYNGDAFDWNDSEERILKDLLVPSGKVFSPTRPFLMVQGNHEPRGNYAREMFDYFDYPSDSCYYAFTQGPVRFIVMDSGEDKEDTHPEYSGLIAFDAYREKQAQWLQKEIESKEFKKAAFKVVFIHIPVFHAGEMHGTLHCRQLFNPIFNKAKIDLAISGHTHRYGTFNADPLTHNYPIMIGGGPGFVGRGGGTRTYIKAKADKKNLLIEMLIDDGTVVGSYNLKK